LLATLPPWLTLPPRNLAPVLATARLLQEQDLFTVCESANCPNASECFTRRTCTFMILGNVCTRGCSFCAVQTGRPTLPDPTEPARVARAAAALGMRHVVVTSVTRDDLTDGGASQFVATIRELRKSPDVTVEALVPDFRGDRRPLEEVIVAGPDVLAHNIETVPRLYVKVRRGAAYERSLRIISQLPVGGAVSKSGLMLGLGETLQEVFEVMADLRSVGCEVLTLGQYLQPSLDCLPVADYVSPSVFDALKLKALAMGFRSCVAGPLVRSSYHAEATVGPGA